MFLRLVIALCRIRCSRACQGVWYGCKHAIPALRRAGGGSIINTASFVAMLGAATSQCACA